MLLLTSTTDKLQITTSAAVTTDVHASFVDNASGVITPGRKNSAITTATTTDVVAAPAAATQRNTQTLNVRNKHATSSQDVTVIHTDGTTAVELFKATLQAGEELQYLDGVGFRVLDASGSQKLAQSGTGRWLKNTVLTSGVSFTTGPQTMSIFVRIQAAGGGGAGCTSVAAAASAGGGGGGGGYAEKRFAVKPNTAYTYALGAQGNGASGALGGTAADSTFSDGVTTVTAKGGVGAAVATALTTLSAYPGGAGGAISTNGDVNSAGAPGEPGVVLIVATPIVASGNGGNSDFGAGGKGITAVGNGNNAVGFGGGGGGAATGASTVRTGGNGGAAVIIVDEFA